MRFWRALLPHDYPRFWRSFGLCSRLLIPLGLMYRTLGWLRWCCITPQQMPVPVICIGNLAIGGVGKTPVLTALAKELKKKNIFLQIIAHGYGGSLRHVTQVDPKRHSAAEVGDEALLLAAVAPTWVGGNRAQRATAACKAGAQLLLLDDGWQDFGLYKDMVIAVVNAEDPFGNGQIFPAGPLRQLPEALAEAEAVIAVGDVDEARHPMFAQLSVLQVSVLQARRRGSWSKRLASGTEIFAFCGLGRSGQFADTVKKLCSEDGMRYRGLKAFGDHYPWNAADLSSIAESAGSATLVTSAKDWQRLPVEWQQRVVVVELALEWSKPDCWAALVKKTGDLRIISR